MKAKEDMIRVKELQPSNSQASQALTRLTKAIADMDKVDLSDVEVKLLKLKDQGNQYYSQKRYIEAIERFSEGISLYLKDTVNFKKDKDVKMKIT